MSQFVYPKKKLTKDLRKLNPSPAATITKPKDTFVQPPGPAVNLPAFFSSLVPTGHSGTPHIALTKIIRNTGTTVVRDLGACEPN